MIGLTAFIVLIDFVSKRLVERLMVEGQSIQLLPGVLRLTYVRNPGAAFGVLPNRTWFFVLVTCLIASVVLFAGRRLTGGDRLLQAALAIMLGGAFGNLFDRLTRDRRVVDFLELPHWPVFNIADIAIVVGVALYLYGTLRDLGRDKEARGQ